MPYKSKAKKRIYKRKYMRRKRSNKKAESERKTNIRPVKPVLRARPDLVVHLLGGEEMYGFEEITE